MDMDWPWRLVQRLLYPYVLAIPESSEALGRSFFFAVAQSSKTSNTVSIWVISKGVSVSKAIDCALLTAFLIYGQMSIRGWNWHEVLAKFT